MGISHSALLLSYGSGAAPNNREAEYIATTTSSDSDNSYSFAGQSFGAADATRRIFVAFMWHYDGGIHRSIDTVTIGGNSATIHVQGGHSGGATGFGVGIASAVVAAGTSGTIVISNDDTLDGMRIATFRTINMERSTPFDTGSDGASGSTDDLHVTVNVPEFGLIIGAHNNSTGANNHVTWSGVTERFDSFGESVAMDYNMDEETNREIDVNLASEGDAGNHMVVVTWN